MKSTLRKGLTKTTQDSLIKYNLANNPKKGDSLPVLSLPKRKQHRKNQRSTTERRGPSPTARSESPETETGTSATNEENLREDREVENSKPKIFEVKTQTG